MNNAKRKTTVKKSVDEKLTEVSASQLVFGKDGVLPAIVQDYESGEVLMLGFMNEDAVAKTFETGYAHYLCREKNEVYKFGANDGNTQKVVTAYLDERKSTLLIKVCQKGYANPEKSEFSRFDTQVKGTYNQVGGVMLGRLQRIIEQNKTDPEEDSYTSFLLARGVDKIAKKVGEEAVELVIAAKNDSKADIVDEASDFLYHMMVLLASSGVKLSEVSAELCKRNR